MKADFVKNTKAGKTLLRSLFIFTVSLFLSGLTGGCKKPQETPEPESGIRVIKAEETVSEEALKEDLGAVPETQGIIEEMVADYGAYGDQASDRVEALLEKLSEEDPDAAGRWNKIMDIWMNEKAGESPNYDVLPDGLPDTDELCIVVLGFQLNPDGSMKDELIERLTVALNSAQKYPNAYIVCTGGGTAFENESATEAGEMAKWLIDQGIAEERVIVENRSLTTAQNAIFTFDILAEKYPSVKKLVIVSSDYHIETGELLFKAESVLRADKAGEESMEVIGNAAWKAPSGTLSRMFQAGALIELSGDEETAYRIYYDTYDIHELPPLE